MTKLYSIKNWSANFENNRSRAITALSWVSVPNRHDGENYTSIISHPEGSKIFSAWILMLQVASKCSPRGTLIRDNQTPHTPQSLSMKTRAPVEWFELALDYLSEHTDWVDYQEVASEVTSTCRPGDVRVTSKCASRARAEQNRTEGNRTEQKVVFSFVEDEIESANGYHSHTRTVLHWLNEKTGRKYRELDANLRIISARLTEPGVDLAGVKQMIEKQVERWKGTEYEQYLRPETLFRKSKFDSYYAGRDCPVIQPTQPGRQSCPVENPRNIGIIKGPTNYAEAAKRKLARQEQEAAALAGQMAGDQRASPAVNGA